MKAIIPSRSFCVLPWTHLFISVDGSFYPCCRSIDSGLPNVDSEGKPFILRDESTLLAAWNSNYMQDLRRTMMACGRPVPCGSCYALEDLHAQSDRQRLNALHEDLLGSRPESSWSETCDPLFRSVDIRLGNNCNLSCRMCSPRASKSLLREFAQLYPASRHATKLANADTPWVVSDEGINTVARYSGDLDELHMAGGEPFLIPQMYRLLERLIETGHSGAISLAYVTNLTTLPSQLKELWAHFKKVRLSVSLDGTEQINSYIRYPSDWAKFTTNVLELDKLASDYNCETLRFYTAVQAYNAFDLPSLFDFIFESFSRFAPFPNLIFVSEPACLDIRVLPSAMREDVSQIMEAYIARSSSIWSSRATVRQVAEFTDKLRGFQRYLFSADRTAELPEFVARTRRHDAFRKQDITTLGPQFQYIFRSSTDK